MIFWKNINYIISELYTFASYNSDTKSIDWIPGIKKENPIMSEKDNKFFTSLSQNYSSTSFNADDLIEYAEKCNISNESLKSFLETTKKSGTAYKTSEEALAGYQKYLHSTAKATTLADISTKALSISMKVISSVGWTLAISAVTSAIGKGLSALDQYINRVDAANEAMKSASSEYESAKSSLTNIDNEITEQSELLAQLQSKDKLTYVEKGQLEELQEITKELLIQRDIEQRKVDNAAKEVGKTTVDAYKKQYGKYDISQSALDNAQEQAKSSGIYPFANDGDDIIGNIGEYLKSQDLLDEVSAKLANTKGLSKNEITELEHNFQFYTDMVENFSENLNLSLTDLEEKQLAMADYYNILSKKQVNNERLTTSEQEALTTYESISSSIMLLYKYTDPNLWNNRQIVNLLNTDDIEKTKEELISMAKDGTLTPETIEGYPKLNDALAKSNLILTDGQSYAKSFCDELYAIANAQKNIEGETIAFGDNSLVDTITTLDQQLSPTFAAISAAYQDIFKLEDGKAIYTPENIDFSKLSSIKSALDNMSAQFSIDVDDASFENLATVLADSSSSGTEVQDAFDALSASILDSLNPSLANCTKENYNAIASILETIGITNAQEIALDALAGRYIDEANAKEILADASLTLESATLNEIAALEQQGTITPQVAARLYELMFAKQSVNVENMDTSSEVANLLNLAENAGYTGKVIEYLTELEQIYQEVASGTFDAPEMIKKNERAAELQRLIKAESSKISLNPKVAYNPNVSSGKAKQAAASAGKQTADTYVEAFDKELKQLDNLKSYGKITEKQYLDALRRLYVKYYGQKKQYLEQYEKYEHQYLSGMKSLYESAFSYITKQIDKRISEVENQRDTEIKGLEAQKKAAEDAYQAQIDAVDEQIKGIEKQIDAKNDEIDAINEAAEARKRELDLQKAQYDLERMQNQKTNYVMTDSGFQYQADTSGIRDARESVEDAKREIEIGKIEETINGLEKQKALLEEQRESLELALEASNAYWDAQIENTNQYYDTLIGNLEAYKSRWEELANLEETAKMQATLAELGIAEQDILNMSEEAFLRVKDSYLAILADMYNGNEQMKGQLAELSALTASTGFDTSGLAASSDEAASAIGKIQESTGGAAESISPLTTELDKLKTLLNDITTLSGSLQFPGIGDEDYAQKLAEIAQGFESIFNKCQELNQIDFSKIIGSSGSSASAGTAASSAAPGIDQGIDAPETSGGGGGFLGLSSAISEAVRSITFQMTLLGLALTIGNMAFAAQIAMINKQYIPAWENLQKRLAEIIGIGGGSENSKNPSSSSTRSVANTGESADAPSGGGTSIIETLQIGGEEVSKKLENPWLSSFTDFATGDNSVQSICEKIKQLVAEMAAAIKEQCESAAKALSDLSAQYLSNPALNGQSTAKESAKNALEAAGNAINKAAARNASVYTPLAQSNPDKYNMLMRFSAQPAPIEAVPLVMSGFSHEMKDAINHVSNAANLSAVNKAVSINIGDIKVEGVSDAGGLAQAIKERLPNMLLQELKKG